MRFHIRIQRGTHLGLKALCLLVGLYLAGCKDEKLELATTSDVNMTGYFEKNSEEYSEFLKILDLTGNAGFLGAYGSYTCFAPTNEAVRLYLLDKKVPSVEALNMDELKAVVKLHLLEDTISTSKFTDGKLPIPTMHGQYLTTGAINENGVTKVKVNRQGNIVHPNIVVGNGVIHGIDRVLQPAQLTISEMIEQMPGYTIFTQALKETGLYDTLKIMYEDQAKTKRRWFTLVAQSDETFKSKGFTNYDSLKSRYSHTGNPKDPTDSLYLFVAYHTLKDIKYLADILTAPSHATLAPLEVVTTRLKGQTVVLNEDIFNGVLEPGIPIDRSSSDQSATNGVIHVASGNFAIKVRKPFPVYWDVADQPELRLMSDKFRKPGQFANLAIGQLQDVTWEGGGAGGDVRYFVEGATTTNQYYYDDGLFVRLRSAVVKWIEFKTPLLVKGKYKIWVGQRRSNGGVFQGFFDGVPTARTFNANDYYPNLSDGDAEAQGYKRYVSVASSTHYARLLGVVDVATTDRHKLRFVALDNNSAGINFDMIHFIPADMDQLWPRFNRDGSFQDQP